MRHHAIATLAIAIGSLISVAAAAAALAVDEDHLKDFWTRGKSEGNAPPLYPREAKVAAASGCVAVAFSIDAAGKTGAPKVLASYITKKDGEAIREHFERNVLAHVAAWRYVPVKTPAQPVSTYATIVAVAEMGLHRQSFQDEVQSHCHVDFNRVADPAIP